MAGRGPGSLLILSTTSGTLLVQSACVLPPMFSKVLPTIVLPGTKLFRVKILQSSCAFLVIDVLGSVWCVPGPSKRNARTHSQRNEARERRKERGRLLLRSRLPLPPCTINPRGAGGTGAGAQSSYSPRRRRIGCPPLPTLASALAIIADSSNIPWFLVPPPQSLWFWAAREQGELVSEF